MAIPLARKVAQNVDSPVLWKVMASLCSTAARVTGSARWHVRLGYARERCGRKDLARQAYERAVARPGSEVAWVLRLGAMYQREGEWAKAERLYASAVDADPGEADVQVQLGRARSRGKDWDGAVAAYEAAAGLDGEQAETLRLLGLARERTGDRQGAVEAYRHALRLADASDESDGSNVRLQLARYLDKVGHWAEARSLLEANIVRHPEHAASHRLLADVAHRMWEWNGYFEGSCVRLEALRFRQLSAGTDPVDARRAHLLACRAMERATALRRSDPRWWAALGSMRREAGYLAGAIESYAIARQRAAASNGTWVFRSLHHWEFEHERAHHDAGGSRVEDPVFATSATPGPGALDAVPERPAGFFSAVVAFSGLRISGFLLSSESDAVEIWLDDVLIRTLNVGGEGFFPRFQISVRRPALELFPRQALLRVRTRSGDPLLAGGRSEGLQLSVPHGSGRLLDIIAGGGQLDKKGAISPSEKETRARQDAFLELYNEVRGFFDDVIGRPVFLLYGTLLGLHRDGELIPGDDDFDAAYISEGTDPQSVKEEAARLIVELVQGGFTVRLNRRGRLLRVEHDAIGGPDLHLDVAPMWFVGGSAWVPPLLTLLCGVEDFLPVEERSLRGTKVYVPRRPEVFLEGNYGPGWKVPDPGFVYHRAAVSSEVSQTFEELLVTPDEYRELKGFLEGEGSRPGMGRLIATGAEPLYPLDDVFL